MGWSLETADELEKRGVAFLNRIGGVCSHKGFLIFFSALSV